MGAPERIRVLLLSDTHLGLDMPVRPRVTRRRRGPEIFEAFHRALAPALEGRVDLVVHGGDLLFRNKVPSWLVEEAMKPLRKVADRGISVFVVPGNHERSRIPFPLLTRYPRIHIFDEPRTFDVDIRGVRFSLSGFPFTRQVAGVNFDWLVEATKWSEQPADVRFLCIHQAVEGATVGIQNYCFRRGPDVVEAARIPEGFAAVLAGHIHRAQVLERDLSDRPLRSPVIFPGSTVRTAFAERSETKGYWLLEAAVTGRPGGEVTDREFVPLQSRPMEVIELQVARIDPEPLERILKDRLDALDPDTIVRLKVKGALPSTSKHVLSAENLRRLAPSTMNVEYREPWIGARTRR